MSVRAAIGATSARLVRQLITEGMLLSGVGCAAGVFFAAWLMVVLRQLVPKTMADGMPFLANLAVNAHTSLFMAGLALLAGGLLAGVSMAHFSIADLRSGLGQGGRTSAGRVWRRLGSNLAAVELAIAVVLLSGAGLLGKSLYRLLHVDLGLNPEHLAAVNVMIPGHAYQNPEQLVGLYDALQRKVRELPSVESVGISDNLPVGCWTEPPK
jgi:hypothetical protein